MSAPVRAAPLGDQALLLVFGDRIDAGAHERVMAAARAIRDATPDGIRELVPAYTTLGVWFDPSRREHGELGEELVRLVSGLPATDAVEPGTEHVIPVRYDGPDLAEVAEHTGLSLAEVIARHSRRAYVVRLLGFVPGFAYLGELDPSLALPRRTPPRQRVPAGSVAIAGEQTAVYPLDTPGGWHLIGRTDLVLFDPRRDRPALLAVGDRVRFVPSP